MRPAIPPRSPRQWFDHLFAAKSARSGGVVRRSIRDMERMVGRDVFLAEIDRRGFTVVENAGQLIVFCNLEPVRLLTRPKLSPESLPTNPAKDLSTDFR